MKRILFFLFLLTITSYSVWAQDSLQLDTTVDSTKGSLIDSVKLQSKKPNFNTDTNNTKWSDTTASKKKKKEPFEQQFRVMVDISHPLYQLIKTNQFDYEIYTDLNINKELFLSVEGGYGGCKVDYDNLKYTSSNAFLRLGIERTFFDPLYKGDWDMITLGFKYGIGIGTRSAATFTVPNPFGGDKVDQIEAKNFMSHWAEITMGLRFELLRNFYLGWNTRVRFNFTTNVFSGQVAPKYLAGFGQGNKATAYGFNFYVGYGIKWQKQRKG